MTEARKTSAPVAVVGAACRFPGVSTLHDFWRQQMRGSTRFRSIPSRWPHHLFFDDQPRVPDKTYVQRGAFLDDVSTFPGQAFGISPKRLSTMDPQHRLLLEATKEAIEDSGTSPESLAGQRVGTFFGLSASEYHTILSARTTALQMAAGAFGVPIQGPMALDDLGASVANVDPISAFSMPGVLFNMAAANIANYWHLTGPAYSIDAACASALLAIYNAVLHIRAGLCDAALAGGVYVNLSPDNLISFARAQAISKRGECRPFDIDADGFLQGEGVGVVFLKSYTRAVSDGDTIYALIRGVGTNNDGQSVGTLTPSAKGQRGAIAMAQADAGLSGAEIDLVECHGTGTPVGDPVEIEALRQCFDVAAHRPVYLNSVKANIGHTMSAAGIAGFLRAMLSLYNAHIAPQASFQQPSPSLRLEESPFIVPTESVPWPQRPWPRRAGVSSFGFGGTNCHLVLEAPPTENTHSHQRSITDEALVAVSAPTVEYLARHARDIALCLRSGWAQQARVVDIAHTLTTRRPLAPVRFYTTARSSAQLAEALEAFASNVSTSAEHTHFGLTEHKGRPVSDWDFEQLYPRQNHRLVHLPPMPLPREEYWVVQPRYHAPLQVQNLAKRSTPAFTADSPAPQDLHRRDDTAPEQPVDDEVLTIISRITAFPKETINPETSLFNHLGMDSLMTMELANELQKQLGLQDQLPASLMTPATTVGDVIDFVRTHALRGEKPEVTTRQIQQRALRFFREVAAVRHRPHGRGKHLPANKAVLVTHDGSSWCETLAASVSSLGLPVVALRWSTEVRVHSANQNIIVAECPAAPDAINELFSKLEDHGCAPTSIIHASCAQEEASLDGEWTVFHRSIALLQELVAAASLTASRPLDLVGVLTGMGGGLGLPLEDGSHSACLPARRWQSALLGFVRALAKEWPNSRVKCVDSNLQDPNAVLNCLLDMDNTSCVGLGPGGHCVRTFQPVKTSHPARNIQLADSTVLVTGGGRGIGYAMAAHIAQRWRCKLLLVGRSAPQRDAALRKNLDALRGMGTQVDYIPWDVSREAPIEVRQSVHQTAPVSLVIHAAGILKDKAVESLSSAAVEELMATKVGGIYHLKQLFDHQQPPLVMGVGSWAAVFGNPHQTVYAAANQAMARALDQWKAGTMQSSVSIAWPPWKDSPMMAALPEAARRALQQRGVPIIDTVQGLALVDQALQHELSGTLVAAVDAPSEPPEYQQELVVSAADEPLVQQHRVQNEPIMPLALGLEYFARMVVAMAPYNRADMHLSDLRIHRPIKVADNTHLIIKARRRATDSAMADLQLFVRDENRSLLPAYQAVAHAQVPAARNHLPPTLSAPAPARVSIAEFYEATGMHGPALQALQTVEALGADHIVGLLNPGSDAHPWAVHPRVLDGGLQLMLLWLWHHRRAIALPVGFSNYIQWQKFPNTPVQCVAVQAASHDDALRGNIYFNTSSGEPIAVLEGLAARIVEPLRPTVIRHPAVSRSLHQENSDFSRKPARRPRVDLFEEVIELRRRREMAAQLGVENPYFPVHEGVAAHTSRIDGAEYINFSSYNYLQLSGDPRVNQAAKEAIDRYGTSVSASRVASGERPIHQFTEAKLAAFLGCEACLLFSAGHATNEAVIGHLLGPKDLIVHDSLAHNSILQGATLSGAARRPFPHNDWQSLEATLRQLRPHYRRVLIAIEGVYSMDGDIPNLPQFIRLRNEYECLLLVDEAHSFGVLGNTGRGIGEHFGVAREEVDIWMGTLSKALASCGGYIAGSHSLIEYLKYTTPGFIFSAGISPANTAAASAALDVMQEEPDRVRRLQAVSRYFLQTSRQHGIDTGLSSGSAVIPCIVGGSVQALQLSATLAKRAINVQPIVYPAVEENAARLRFFLSCGHTREQIDSTIAAVADTLAHIKAKKA